MKAVWHKTQEYCKNNYQLLILIAVFFGIRLLFMQRFHSIIWDEGVYLAIGKYIYSAGASGLWEIIRPIGLPLIIGMFWKLGFNYVLLSELITTLFAVGNIVFVYSIGKKLWGQQAGIIAAFLLAVQPLFFLYTGYILTGIPSMFFILAAVYMFVSNKYAWAGCFAAVASLFRFPQGIFLVAALATFAIAYKEKDALKHAKSFVLAFVLTHVPFLVFNFIKYNAETSRIHHALFRPWILGMTHSGNPAEQLFTTKLLDYTFYVRSLFSENILIGLAVIGLILYVYKKGYLKKNMNIIVIALLLFAGYFSYIPNKQIRFALVFLPYLALLAGYGTVEVVKRISKEETWKRNIKVTFILLLVVAYFGAMQQDKAYYGWRPAEPFPVVEEFYKFLEKHPVEGTILTADPVPAVYVDNKFEPYYYSLDAAEEIYAQHTADVGAIIYTNETFFCLPDNFECNARISYFEADLNKNHVLTFSKDYNSRSYFIFT